VCEENWRKWAPVQTGSGTLRLDDAEEVNLRFAEVDRLRLAGDRRALVAGGVPDAEAEIDLYRDALRLPGVATRVGQVQADRLPGALGLFRPFQVDRLVAGVLVPRLPGQEQCIGPRWVGLGGEEPGDRRRRIEFDPHLGHISVPWWRLAEAEAILRHEHKA